ncbi:hypothetical protein [Nocardioides pyridinolyticus]
MSARRLTLALFGVGVLLLAVGTTVFFAFFPHSVEDWFGFAAAEDPFADWEMGWPEPSGDLRLTMVSAAISGAGFLVLLVPIIAWGEQLGRRLGETSR